MNKKIAIICIVLAMLIGAIGMYLICNYYFQSGTITATRMDIVQYMMAGHATLTKQYGEVMSQEDFDMWNEILRQVHTGDYTIQVDSNGNIVVIEYGNRDYIFAGYVVKSVKVFTSDEWDSFVAYIAGS